MFFSDTISINISETKELKEWWKSVNVGNFIQIIDQVDKSYCEEIKKNPKAGKQIKERFVDELKEMLSILENNKHISYKHFSSLFNKVNQSATLNIHENPRLDAFFKIKIIKSKQKALKEIRYTALPIFERKMNEKLSIIKSNNEDPPVKAGQYKQLQDEIWQAMNLNLFCLTRSNWPSSQSDSFQAIKDRLYDPTNRARRHALGQYTPPPSPPSF